MRSTSIAAWLTVAVWIATHASVTQAPNPNRDGHQGPFDLNELTEELMSPVFRLMKAMGEEMRDAKFAEWNGVAEGAEVKQFLLVAVLARDEIEHVSKSNKFPRQLTTEYGHKDNYVTEMFRMFFLLNKSLGKDQSKKLYGRALHTEVAAFELGYLQRLKARFADEHDNAEYPVILMYSHYIPCNGVPQLHYSCAQEIKNYAHNRYDDFGLIVAFTEMFKNTNAECSRQHLREGGVPLFQYQDGDGKYERIEDFAPIQRTVGQDQQTLQENIYNAFVRAISPTHQCCIGDDANKETIVAFFVNELTHSCTRGSSKSRRVSKGGKYQLKGCMETFIGDNMGNECVKCSGKGLSKKLQGKLCGILDKAANDEILLGKPPGTNDRSIYNPTWKPYDGAWKNLYSMAPSEEALALPAVMCADRKLSRISLCTKREPVPSEELALKGLEEGLELVKPENQETLEFNVDVDVPDTHRQECGCTEEGDNSRTVEV